MKITGLASSVCREATGGHVLVCVFIIVFKACEIMGGGVLA